MDDKPLIIKIVIECIGSLILAALIIAIPILTTCSFFLNWPSMFQLILGLLTTVEFAIVLHQLS